MIRKILIITVALSLITLGILDLVFVNKTFKNLILEVDELNLMITQNEDKNEIEDKAKNIEEKWIKSEKRLTVFLYYRDIDTLGKQVDLVSSLIENDDLEQAKTEVMQLQYLINSVSKVYEFNFDNLL